MFLSHSVIEMGRSEECQEEKVLQVQMWTHILVVGILCN